MTCDARMSLFLSRVVPCGDERMAIADAARFNVFCICCPPRANDKGTALVVDCSAAKDGGEGTKSSLFTVFIVAGEKDTSTSAGEVVVPGES